MPTNPEGRHQDRALDALLAGYAAGTLSPPLHVLVAGHLALSPRSRTLVRGLEAAAGAALGEVGSVPVADREGKLAAIFAADEPIARPEPPADELLPFPLRHYLGRTLVDLPWRPLLPGVRQCRVEESDRGEASFYRIRPGRKMPRHTHDGSEYTLVLQGGFSDVTGHYRRGDVAIADSEIDHRPVADDDQECVCFAVTDAPLRLTGPVGRWIQKFLGS